MAGAGAMPVIYITMRALAKGRAAAGLLLHPRTWELLAQTAVLVAGVTAAAILVAVPLAWLTTRTDLPGKRVWSVLLSVPLVVPSYVGAFTFIAAFGPRGMLQQILSGPFGVERLPDIYGFPGALVTLTLFSYPYVFLTVRAAFLRMNPALEETARTLGHGGWSVFRRVTLPQLRPFITSGALLVALYTMSDFGAVSLLRYNSFTRAIFLQYGAAFDRSYAALLSLILLCLSTLVLVAETRARGRGRLYLTGSVVDRPVPVFRLGRWRAPALTFCAAVCLMSLMLPLSISAYWLTRGIGAGELLLKPATAWNSFSVSGLAAVLGILAAIPPAYLAVRHPGRLTLLIERFTYVGFALPGIVVALGFVFFSVNYAGLLYQSMALLVLAYLVNFYAQGVGSVRSTLLQVKPSVEEAARCLGKTPGQAFLRVTLPLVKPGILAGAALIFLTTMKELPITLLLGPTGFQTLATSVWSATENAYYARAAGPALALILLSFTSVFWLMGTGNREAAGASRRRAADTRTSARGVHGGWRRLFDAGT